MALEPEAVEMHAVDAVQARAALPLSLDLALTILAASTTTDCAALHGAAIAALRAIAVRCWMREKQYRPHPQPVPRRPLSPPERKHSREFA